MCHFLALSGQAEMMRENFMRMALPVFVACCLRMKFSARWENTSQGFLPYLFWGFTILRQSRSPRRKPWTSTSAVAALVAKGI